MDIRQLEYAVAVADHGGFTSAARAVHVSQPSLSHGIRSCRDGGRSCIEQGGFRPRQQPF